MAFSSFGLLVFLHVGLLAFWLLVFWPFELLFFWYFGLWPLAFWSFGLWSFGVLPVGLLIFPSFGLLVVWSFVFVDSTGLDSTRQHLVQRAGIVPEQRFIGAKCQQHIVAKR